MERLSIARCVGLGLATFLAASQANTSHAEQSEPTKGATLPNSVRPSLEGIGAILPVGEGRVVRIYRQADRDQVRVLRFFYGPLFIFEERAPSANASIRDLPSTVLDVYSDRGAKFLRMRVLWSAASAKAKTIALAEDNDPEVTNRTPRVPVDASHWPITYLSAQIVRTTGKGEPVGEIFNSEFLGNQDPFSDLHFRVSDDDLSTIRSDVQSGRPPAVKFWYQYSNIEQSYAKLSATFSSQLASIVSNELAMHNQSPYIFRRDADDLQRRINNQFQVYVSSNDASLLAVLTSQVMTDYVKPVTVDSVAILKDESLKSAISKHFEPLINDITKSSEINTRTKSESDSGINFGVDVEFVKFGADLKNKSEREDGAVFRFNESKKTYSLQSIRMYRVESIDARAFSTIVQALYLDRGTSDSWMRDTPVPITLTASTASIGGPGVDSPIFATIQPGMALCYLGKGLLPKGYVELDGTQQWPSSNWAAQPAGTPLPDTRGALVGGISGGELGTISQPAQLELSVDLAAALKQTSISAVTFRGRASDSYGRNTGDLDWKDRVLKDPLLIPEPKSVSLVMGPINPWPNSKVALFAAPYEAPAVARVPKTDMKVSALGKIPSAAAPAHLQCRWVMRTQ